MYPISYRKLQSSLRVGSLLLKQLYNKCYGLHIFCIKLAWIVKNVTIMRIGEYRVTDPLQVSSRQHAPDTDDILINCVKFPTGASWYNLQILARHGQSMNSAGDEEHGIKIRKIFSNHIFSHLTYGIWTLERIIIWTKLFD